MIVDVKNFRKIKVGDRLVSQQTCDCGCGLKKGEIYTVVKKMNEGLADMFALELKEVKRDVYYKICNFRFETLNPPTPVQNEFSF